MKFRAIAVSIAVSFCALGQSPTYNTAPSRAFGQPQLTPVRSGSPNLVEGREFYSPQSLAFDTSSNPPAVFVADYINNRILGWKNATGIAKGDAADLVIGQNDPFSTNIGGPATPQTIGLYAPGAVAVDASGNLYVADTGNNRILRFPKPFAQFAQNGYPITPDLVIGQRTFSSGNAANEGNAVPSAKTLAFTSGGFYVTAMAFDRQGNLWVTDPVNNRVLRFPAGNLTTGTIEPAADLALGQQNFVTGTLNEGSQGLLNKSTLVQPAGLALADNGDLYVSDSRARVLYFKAPLSNGQAAARIIGITSPTTSDPQPRAFNGCPSTAPQPCESALGAVVGGRLFPQQGLAVLANSLFVADTFNNRVVKFDPPDRWAPECTLTNGVCAAGTVISPPGIQFIGQLGGQATKPNQAGQPGANTMSQPSGLAFLGTDLWVVDTANNRVTVWGQAGGIYPGAYKLLGQTDFGFNAPNLVEGRELFVYDPASRQSAAGIAVDSTTDPPHFYIADTFNNRILGFRDARKVKPGDRADIVIGQPDFFSTLSNYVTRDPAAPTESTLSQPVGLLVGPAGDLFVADSGNARVLRFPRPFDQAGGYRANLVLGQPNFFGPLNTSPSQSTMRLPWGLAFTSAGHLFVSDASLNRVLLFKKPAGGDFTSGARADAIIGQPDYFTVQAGNALNRLNSPRGLAIDSSDRLYVADYANNRVAVFASAEIINGAISPSARFTPSIGSPSSIAVNSRGEIWVTDPSQSRMLRFPIFEDWVASTSQSNSQGQAISALVASPSIDPNYPVFPIAIALDGNDNPIVAESVNRVSFYFIQATFQNIFSYATRALTPGMLAYFYRVGPPIPGIAPASAAPPLPTSLGDVQVLVNGKEAPIFNVSSTRVDFQVPWSAPTSGVADFQLVRASSGEVLAAGTLPMQIADPSLATANATGAGQLAAINADGSINSPANPAKSGTIISLFGTGLGPVSNAPPDGQGASGVLAAPGLPRVSMANPGPGVLDSSYIQYFGLVSWFPGVFQLNVKIPDGSDGRAGVPPSNTVNVGIFWQDIVSTTGPNGSRVITTIAVK